jgi:flagellar biosynthetic protein FliR
MVIGLIMGFTITVVIAGCQAAGEFMGFQMMFTAASTFMAYTQEESTVISNYFYILTVLIFVSLDGQHWLIQALVKSFEVVPVYGLPDGLGPMRAWVHFFGNIFEVALHLALPVMGVLLITNLMLGMIARTMPQLNVFVIGLPVQILAGILMMIVMISGLTLAENAIFRQWSRELLALVQSMGGS